MSNEKNVNVEQIPENPKPTLEKGNYAIEIMENGQVIRKVVAINATINITQLSKGAMAIDIK